MERVEAEIIVRSLVGRMKATEACFDLPGGAVSGLEMEALKLLSGMVSTNTISLPINTGQSLPGVELNMNCLEAAVDASAVLCIDFGTAFSKAAIWRDKATLPAPLDLVGGAEPGRTGVLLESAAYISSGKIFFGPAAVDRFRTEDAPERDLFSSPKELLTHDAARLDIEQPTRAVDPTGRFTYRALLTLYLGYLTAIACTALPRGIGRTVKRRYAAPGWNNAQADVSSRDMGLAARSLGDLLVDAQILADTIPVENWRAGLDIDTALALDAAIRNHRDKREGRTFPFVERAVLEAVAAGSGIRDRFINKRPQVLVVDVGAGTTDIGVFKYVNAPSGDGVVAPYAGGMRAVQIAGNALDDALIGLAQKNLGLASDTDRSRRFKRRLTSQIRELKAKLCEMGEIEIEIPDFPKVAIELPEFVGTPIVSDYLAKFGNAIVQALDGSGASFRSFSDDNVVVFTGGGKSLPFLRKIFDQKAINLKSGPAYFLLDDAIPDWVNRTVPDVSQLFPQVAVATGGCSPYLPDEARVVNDTSNPGKLHLAPMYKN